MFPTRVAVWLALTLMVFGLTARAACPTLWIENQYVPLYEIQPIVLAIDQVFGNPPYTKPYVWSLDLCGGNAPTPPGTTTPCSSPGYVQEYSQSNLHCEQTFTTVYSTWQWNGTAANVVFATSSTTPYIINVGILCGNSSDLVALAPVYVSEAPNGQVSFDMQFSSLAACPVTATTPAPMTPSPAPTTPPNSISVSWNTTVAGKTVALAANGAVLLSSQISEFGGYMNTIAALSIATSAPLWSFASFGTVEGTTTAFSLGNQTGIILLALNNLQLPNITAVTAATGAVLWSNTVGFADSIVDVLVSVDRAYLFVITAAEQGQQLTSMQAATGAVAFTLLSDAVHSTRCLFSIACVASLNTTSRELTFVDGFGAVLRQVNLPGKIWSGTPVQMESIGSTLLVFAEPTVYAVDTDSSSLLWFEQVTDDDEAFVSVRLMSTSPHRVSDTVAVLMNASGMYGINATTGALAWQDTVASLCPSRPPAPSKAVHLIERELSRVSVGGSMISFSGLCVYPNGAELVVLGLVSLRTGSLSWWRYLEKLNYDLPFPMVPAGSEGFAVVDQRSYNTWTVDVYASSQQLVPAASFVWAPPEAGWDIQVLLSAADGMLLLQEYINIQPPSYQLVAVVP